MFFILVNSVILGLKWYGQSPEYNAYVEKINLALTSIFSAELMINFIGFGPRYLKDNWNLFDFIIIMISWLATIVGGLSNYQLGP
jgi:voltage-gated sodium channel